MDGTQEQKSGHKGAEPATSGAIVLSTEDQAKLNALKKKRQRIAQDYHVSLYNEGSLGLCSGTAVDDFAKKGYFQVRSESTTTPSASNTAKMNELRAFILKGEGAMGESEAAQYYIPSLIVNCARGLKPPADGLEVRPASSSIDSESSFVPLPVVVRHLPTLPNDPWHVDSIFTRKSDEKEVVLDPEEVRREEAEVEEHFKNVVEFVKEVLEKDEEEGWPRRTVFLYQLAMEDNKTQRLTPFLLTKATELVTRVTAAIDAGTREPGCPFRSPSTLFHCVAGKSRSVCMLAATMMSEELLVRSQSLFDQDKQDNNSSSKSTSNLEKLNEMPSLFLTVFGKIQAGRPEADPNSWFRLQMVKFGQYLLETIKTRPASIVATPRPAGHSRGPSYGSVGARSPVVALAPSHFRTNSGPPGQ